VVTGKGKLMQSTIYDFIINTYYLQTLVLCHISLIMSIAVIMFVYWVILRNVYRVLVGKPEGRRPLERPRRRWEDGINMDLREIGWGVWSGFTWLRIGIFGGLL
jgi:hypothetical protein